jgi:DNA adenine methylase
MAVAAVANAQTLKPALKWAGGKRWLVPRLRELWMPFRGCRLVEPLSGGMAVALGLMPERALLNDINPHAINFHRWLKRGLRIAIEMRNEAAMFYTHRARFNELIAARRAETREAASLFYYLNRTGYNGLCRFNRSGAFNVPFGRHRQINYVADFTAYRDAFSRWEFTVGDFDRIAIRDDDFIYADPPYDVEFTQYCREPFGWAEQVRLADWLAGHRGVAIVSNQATPRVLRLYRELGFRTEILSGPRMISCTGDRSPALEVLAIKGL